MEENRFLKNSKRHIVHHEGGATIISDTALKVNLSKDLEMAMQPDISITKNIPTANKPAVLDGLVGIVTEAAVTDEETIREERLARQ